MLKTNLFLNFSFKVQRRQSFLAAFSTNYVQSH